MERKCEWTKKINTTGGREIIAGTCHGFFQYQDRDEAEACAIFEVKESGEVKTVAVHEIKFMKEKETDCNKCYHAQPCKLIRESKECKERFSKRSSQFRAN